MCAHTHTHTHTHTNTHTYAQTYTHSRTRNPTLNPPTPILPLNYKLTKDGLPQPSRQGEEQQKETNEKVYLRILSLKQCQLATPIAKAKERKKNSMSAGAPDQRMPPQLPAESQRGLSNDAPFGSSCACPATSKASVSFQMERNLWFFSPTKVDQWVTLTSCSGQN